MNKDLIKMYREYCDCHESCDTCPLTDSICMLEFAYQQGRTEAIEEYKKKIEFEEKWLLCCKVFNPNVTIAFKTLKTYAEQLKEQNND